MRPRHWRNLAAAVFAAFFLSYGHANSATIQTDCCGPNTATGLKNLLVGGAKFNIDFVTGSFEQVYGGDETVLSGNFAYEVFKAFDASPTLISAVTDQNGTLSDRFFAPTTVFDPFTINIGGFLFVEFGFEEFSPDPIINQWVGCGESPSCGIASSGAERTWLVVTPVPLPAALPIFASALGVLGLIGWRRRRRNG